MNLVWFSILVEPLGCLEVYLKNRYGNAESLDISSLNSMHPAISPTCNPDRGLAYLPTPENEKFVKKLLTKCSPARNACIYSSSSENTSSPKQGVSVGTISQKATGLRTSLSASLRNRVSLGHIKGVVNVAYHALLLLLPQLVRAELGLFLCVLNLISLTKNQSGLFFDRIADSIPLHRIYPPRRHRQP